MNLSEFHSAKIQTEVVLPLHKIIEQLELQNGLSEKEVLYRLQVPRSTYRGWKIGTCEPSRRVYWKRLADALNTSVEYLICGERKSQAPHDLQLRLF